MALQSCPSQPSEEDDSGVKGLVIHYHGVSNFLVYKVCRCVSPLQRRRYMIIVNHDSSLHPSPSILLKESPKQPGKKKMVPHLPTL
jgi:hypothetical protein